MNHVTVIRQREVQTSKTETGWCFVLLTFFKKLLASVAAKYESVWVSTPVVLLSFSSRKLVCLQKCNRHGKVLWRGACVYVWFADSFTSLCDTVLHYTSLYFTILHCTKLYYFTSLCDTVLHYTLLYFTILHCTKLYYTVLYYTTLYCTVLYYTILLCTSLHYTSRHYTTLHVTILHCTTLYFTILQICKIISTIMKTIFR